MTFKEAKSWLNRARRLDVEINKLEEQRMNAYTSLTSGTQKYSSEPGGGSTDPHKFEHYAELSDTINTSIDRLCAVKSEVLQIINQLEDGRERIVLISYCVNGDTFEQIGEEMHYTMRWVQELYIRGIEHAKQFIEVHI